MSADLGRVVTDHVVLCGPDGGALGTAAKSAVHHRATPLHLAFSCYVLDPDGRLLVTRRARHKATFPGLRTNSCCGHPRPGEGMRAAVTRRLDEELGIVPERLDLILPTFAYHATAVDGTLENELCPVYRAFAASPAVQLDLAEVDDAWWEPWPHLEVDGPDPLSPWAALQVAALRALGPDPAAWPTGDPATLPGAATP